MGDIHEIVKKQKCVSFIILLLRTTASDMPKLKVKLLCKMKIFVVKTGSQD